MFGNFLAAEIIARIFEQADREVRREITNSQNPLEINELERVATLCALIRQKVSRNPLIRSFSIQAHSRDTTRRDALFVFRYKEEVKIGIVEAKLLRIKNARLTDVWDWYKGGSNKSHFTDQVHNQQLFVNEVAVWEMFIPDCNPGVYTPSLCQYGSSNIWANKIILNAKINNENELWTYQDVLDAMDNYLPLYSIIKEILLCKSGKKHNITGKNNLEIVSSNPDIKMKIPIPRNQRLSNSILSDFFKINKNIDSLNYYRFDELFHHINNKQKDIIDLNEFLNENSSLMEELDLEYLF